MPCEDYPCCGHDPYDCPSDVGCCDDCYLPKCECDYEDDGQPDEYTEWQDVYGGDVEEYGSFGDYDHGDY